MHLLYQKLRSQLSRWGFPVSFSCPRFVLTLSLLLISFISFSQEYLTYNQYMNNLSPYNSAYSLLKLDGNINLSTRQQWVGIDGAPRSYLLSSNWYMKSIGASSGLIVNQDKFGVENQSSITAFFAKSVRLTDNTYFGLSINGGFQSYKAYYSLLDPADPKFRDDINQQKGIAGGAILISNPKKFYVGISMPNLSRGNTLYLSFGSLHELNSYSTIKNAVLVSYLSYFPTIANISTTLYFGAAGIGVAYRTTKELAGIFSCSFGNLQAGYSYEVGLNNLTIGAYSNGSHELTLGFALRKSNNKNRW